MTKQEAIAKIIEMWDTVEFDRCGSPGERAAHKQELQEVLDALNAINVSNAEEEYAMYSHEDL
jgi:hypothetical protein